MPQNEEKNAYKQHGSQDPTEKDGQNVKKVKKVFEMNQIVVDTRIKIHRALHRWEGKRGIFRMKNEQKTEKSNETNDKNV